MSHTYHNETGSYHESIRARNLVTERAHSLAFEEDGDERTYENPRPRVFVVALQPTVVNIVDLVPVISARCPIKTTDGLVTWGGRLITPTKSSSTRGSLITSRGGGS